MPRLSPQRKTLAESVCLAKHGFVETAKEVFYTITDPKFDEYHDFVVSLIEFGHLKEAADVVGALPTQSRRGTRYNKLVSALGGAPTKPSDPPDFNNGAAQTSIGTARVTNKNGVVDIVLKFGTKQTIHTMFTTEFELLHGEVPVAPVKVTAYEDGSIFYDPARP